MVEWMKLINHQISSVKADKEMKKDPKKLYILTLDLYTLMQTVSIMVLGMCLVVKLIGPLPGPLPVRF